MIRPLIFVPSPRDLPEFIESTSKLKFDKLWVKYYPQQEAYDVGRQWFLERDYTHLIILPDDLLVTQNDLDLLIDELYVVSGWCVHGKSPDERKGLDSNISNQIPDPPHQGEYDDYEYIPVSDLTGDVISVVFAGFAPTVIPRAIVKEIPFRTDEGCCVDSCFGLDLLDHNIIQYCNTKVKTREISATDPELLQVGKKEKEIRFETKTV